MPRVLGRHALLVRVVQNLLANSLKFRKEDVVHINIFAKEDDDAWTFCVEDNGVGIPKEEQQRVFALFTQGKKHSQQREGLGIGMAYVKRVIESHAGKVWLDSEEGQRTRVSFRIPKNPL